MSLYRLLDVAVNPLPLHHRPECRLLFSTLSTNRVTEGLENEDVFGSGLYYV